MVVTEFIAKVDLGGHFRWVAWIHNTDNKRYVPLSMNNREIFAKILEDLGFGILVEPNPISIKDFFKVVQKDSNMKLVDWEGEMGVHT